MIGALLKSIIDVLNLNLQLSFIKFSALSTNAALLTYGTARFKLDTRE